MSYKLKDEYIRKLEESLHNHIEDFLDDIDLEYYLYSIEKLIKTIDAFGYNGNYLLSENDTKNLEKILFRIIDENIDDIDCAYYFDDIIKILDNYGYCNN